MAKKQRAVVFVQGGKKTTFVISGPNAVREARTLVLSVGGTYHLEGFTPAEKKAIDEEFVIPGIGTGDPGPGPLPTRAEKAIGAKAIADYRKHGSSHELAAGHVVATEQIATLPVGTLLWPANGEGAKVVISGGLVTPIGVLPARAGEGTPGGAPAAEFKTSFTIISIGNGELPTLATARRKVDNWWKKKPVTQAAPVSERDRNPVKTKDLRITNDKGRKFLVHVVRQGDRYGLNKGLTHSGPEPMIEFYDLTQAKKHGFGPEGQFVSRYDARTLARPHANGIDLHGSEPAWKIDAAALAPVVELARTLTRAQFGNAVEEQRQKHLKTLAVKMHNWHSSAGDPIYAVGSYYYTGKRHPSIETERAALENISMLLEREKDPANRRELSEIKSALELTLGDAASSGARRGNPFQSSREYAGLPYAHLVSKHDARARRTGGMPWPRLNGIPMSPAQLMVREIRETRRRMGPAGTLLQAAHRVAENHPNIAFEAMDTIGATGASEPELSALQAVWPGIRRSNPTSAKKPSKQKQFGSSVTPALQGLVREVTGKACYQETCFIGPESPRGGRRG